MYIAMVATFACSKNSGAETSTRLICEKLSKKHTVELFTTKVTIKTPYLVHSIPGSKRLPDPMLMVGTKAFDMRASRYLKRCWKQKRPDVVHIHDFSILPAAVNAAKSLGIPTVLTVRDTRYIANLTVCFDLDDLPMHVGKKEYITLLKKQTKQVYGTTLLAYALFPWFWSRSKTLVRKAKQVTTYIAVSDFVNESLSRSGLQGAKTIIVPKPDWSYELPPKNKHTTILCAGLLVELKGFQTVIKAMKLLKEKKYKLLIAGDGSYKKQLQDLITELGVQDQVTLLGQVKAQQLKELYKKADMCVVPSIVPESLSRIIFESFTTGRPVIASTAGGSAQLVQHGKTGYIFPTKDHKALAEAIQTLAKDEDKRVAYGKEGNELVNRVANPERCVEDHEKCYKGLITENEAN